MEFPIKRMAAAVSVALLHISSAAAQDAKPEAPADDGLNMESARSVKLSLKYTF